MRALFDGCKSFIIRINQNQVAMVDSLWPRFSLDPEEEIRFFVRVEFKHPFLISGNPHLKPDLLDQYYAFFSAML